MSLGPALLVLVLVGLLLLRLGSWSHRSRGFLEGDTRSTDSETLSSERLGLTGRPDRLVEVDGVVIPEEWKPTAKRVSPSHRLQLGAYLLLVEEEYGKRPPYGVVVIRDGKRVEVSNSEGLRSEVLGIAGRIREHRERLGAGVAVRQPPAKCLACGRRGNCEQARSG